MDEGVISPVDAEEFIRLGMMDGLTIKISRAGGLESSRQQILRVLDAGLFWLGSGLSDPDLSLAASLALFAAYGLEKPAALNGPQFQRDSILTTPLSVCGDLAELPEGPGLGVEVDETKIRRCWPASDMRRRENTSWYNGLARMFGPLIPDPTHLPHPLSRI